MLRRVDRGFAALGGVHGQGLRPAKARPACRRGGLGRRSLGRQARIATVVGQRTSDTWRPTLLASAGEGRGGRTADRGDRHQYPRSERTWLPDATARPCHFGRYHGGRIWRGHLASTLGSCFIRIAIGAGRRRASTLIGIRARVCFIRTPPATGRAFSDECAPRRKNARRGDRRDQDLDGAVRRAVR